MIRCSLHMTRQRIACQVVKRPYSRYFLSKPYFVENWNCRNSQEQERLLVNWQIDICIYVSIRSLVWTHVIHGNRVGLVCVYFLTSFLKKYMISMKGRYFDLKCITQQHVYCGFCEAPHVLGTNQTPTHGERSISCHRKSIPQENPAFHRHLIRWKSAGRIAKVFQKIFSVEINHEMQRWIHMVIRRSSLNYIRNLDRRATQ